MKHVQTRSGSILAPAPVTVADAPGGRMVLHGLAAVYNSETDLGPFREVIAPGAFSASNLSDVRFMLNHAGLPMGRTTAGTLEVHDTPAGLFYRVLLPDTAEAHALYTAVKRGDISQSSFAFTIGSERWDTARGLRIVEAVETVFDVSAVAFPAYESATVNA